MTYNEIKGCIDRSRKEIMADKKALKVNEDEQETLRKSMLNVESSYQLNIREERERALQQYVTSKLTQYDASLTSLQQNVDATSASYEQDLKDAENADVSGSYSDEEAMASEVRAALAVLQTQLNKTISPRFQFQLESQLATQELNIQPEDVDRIVRFFNEQSRSIAKMGTSSNMDRFIDNVLSMVRVPLPESGDNSNKNKISYGVLSVLIVVVFIYAAKYVFPFYVAFLAALLLYNLGKHYKIYIALIAQKAVKDNLALIESTLKDKAVAKKEARLQDICAKYDKALLDLQQQIEKTTADREKARISAEREFTYDTSDAQERYQNAVKFNNSRMQTLQNEHKQLLDDLRERQAELTRFENDLNQLAGGVQDEYLNFDKVGSDVIFNTKFIVDIKNSKPVYFQHPQNSCVFLYSNSEDMNDLIKLLLIQLRIKLSPSNLICSVLDTEGLGMPFLAFNTNEEGADETVKNLFKIVTTMDDIKNHMSEYNDLVSKRIMIIRKSYDSIAEYNQAMLESDSLTETYDFIFCQNPTSQILSDDNFRKVYSNGGSLGIYTHVFVRLDEFYNMNDTAKFLIENAGGIYVLKDGAILKRAKEFALENLIKPSN